MKHEYDSLFHSAFAEIYHTALVMEQQKKLEINLSCDEMAEVCVGLADEFCETYDSACKLGGEPSFYYDALDTFINDKLPKVWPVMKKFEATYSVYLRLDRTMYAKDSLDAKKIQQNELDLTNNLAIRNMIKKKIDEGAFTMTCNSINEVKE